VALVVNSPRGSEVAACCSRAVAQGVRPGMPLVEAQALIRELGVATYDPAADRRALVKCAEACERFSPRVALEDGAEPESVLLDISNLEHLWGSEAKLVGRVEEFFTQRGYLVRLAAAETVGAAWAKAHFEGEGRKRNPNDECRMTNEKSACSSFGIRHSSFTLPVQALRIPEEMASLLRELGIETVGQLVALPREELASRFGDELLRRLDQLTGTGREVIEPERALAALEASYALEEPTADRAVLIYVLKQLVNQLARQLVARDQGAVLLVCLLHLTGDMNGVDEQPPAPPGVHPMRQPSLIKKPPAEPGAIERCQGVPPQVLRVGLLQPSASARQLLELIELHLETVKLADEVDRVELRAAVVGRLGEWQGELFADRWPRAPGTKDDLPGAGSPHQLAVLVNRLSSRLGDERVLRAELRASPVPERAVKWRGTRDWELGAGVGNKRKDRETRRQGDKEKSRRSPAPCLPLSLSPYLAPRPLLLYPQPQALEVVCVAPDGPPQFVWLGNRREPIVECIGPERIETLWWRGPLVRRDYYRVATESGNHLWMFRRWKDGRWFVHGVFA
jgi:protein ImuB